MSKGHGIVERGILLALTSVPGGEGGRPCDDTKRLAEQVAHYRVCGETIHDHDHIWRCPVHDAYKDRVVDLSLGRPVAEPPAPTRAELEAVRRALRNLRKQGLVVVGYKIPARTFHVRPRRKLKAQRLSP
jgi:hypothetical protein